MGDDLLKGSGTSQAAAVVSGAVALLLERRPDLTPDQVKAIIKSSADPLSGPGPDAQGAGRLNVIRALAAASPDPAAVRQPFRPPQIRGIVARLVAGLSKRPPRRGRARRPRRLELGRRQVGRLPSGAARSWGGSSWGGSSWGGSSWGGSSWGGSSWGGSSWGGSSWASDG